MPLQLEIIRAAEFIRVGARGKFDFAASQAALATVAGACRKRGVHNAVVDLRALQPGPKPVFSRADLVELVKTFPAVGFTRQLRLAILYQSDPHKRARLFAFLSTLHGWNVRAFGDFERALLWLSQGQETAAPGNRPPAGQTIPIRFSGPQAGAPTPRVPRGKRPGNPPPRAPRRKVGRQPGRGIRACAGQTAARSRPGKTAWRSALEPAR